MAENIIMQNYVAQFLIVLLLFISASPIAAQTGDWNALTAQVNKEVAVKTKNRKTVFGILTEADSDLIKVKTSGGNSVSEVSFRREEVDKVWFATLSKDSRKTLLGVGVGAAVGAGVGAGAGLILLGATGGSDDFAGILVTSTAIGAGIGAAIGGASGFFSRSKNKKDRLIYQK